MFQAQRRVNARYVVGPDGSLLTLTDLQQPDSERWVIQRKAQVASAVRGGLISLESFWNELNHFAV